MKVILDAVAALGYFRISILGPPQRGKWNKHNSDCEGKTSTKQTKKFWNERYSFEAIVNRLGIGQVY